MSMVKMTDLDLRSKRVFIREDFNVPIQDGKITSDARIHAALPTIEQAKNAGAKVVLMSHLGRPQKAAYDPKFSLEPVAKRLSELLQQDVPLKQDWLDGLRELQDGSVTLCENVRFNVGETDNDDALAKKVAALTDVYVMDAFGSAHRAHVSTYGVAKYAPIACAGPLLVAELEALSRGLENPRRPVVAIVAGAKVSTKLGLLESLLALADQIIVGGGIANTFIAAQGHVIGRSLHEKELIAEAKHLLEKTKIAKANFPLPSDVIVATEFSADAPATIKAVDEISPQDMVLDIGPQTAREFIEIINKAGTIIWNGPIGVFEFDKFAEGTKALAMAIATSSAFSIAGGGDTIAAIEKYAIADKISYISTGGGAFLKFLEGKKLPAVAMLQQRGQG